MPISLHPEVSSYCEGVWKKDLVDNLDEFLLVYYFWKEQVIKDFLNVDSRKKRIVNSSCQNSCHDLHGVTDVKNHVLRCTKIPDGKFSETYKLFKSEIENSDVKRVNGFIDNLLTNFKTDFSDTFETQRLKQRPAQKIKSSTHYDSACPDGFSVNTTNSRTCFSNFTIPSSAKSITVSLGRKLKIQGIQLKFTDSTFKNDSQLYCSCPTGNGSQIFNEYLDGLRKVVLEGHNVKLSMKYDASLNLYRYFFEEPYLVSDNLTISYENDQCSDLVFTDYEYDESGNSVKYQAEEMCKNSDLVPFVSFILKDLDSGAGRVSRSNNQTKNNEKADSYNAFNLLKSKLAPELKKHLPSNATIELRIKCPVDRWNFGRSLVFSITTITTIGYGTWKPTRMHSKVFCVIYASFGIPLFLCLVFIWTKIFKNLEYKTRKSLKNSEDLVSRKVDIVSEQSLQNRDSKTCMTRKILIRVVSVTFLYFIIPALIIQRAEVHERSGFIKNELENPWSFGEALYYCFITLTTIGYGDYMTWGNNLSENVQRFYFVFIEIWKVAGLVGVSLVVNRVSEKVNELVERTK